MSLVIPVTDVTDVADMADVTAMTVHNRLVTHQRLFQLLALPRRRLRLRPAVRIRVIRAVKVFPQRRRRGIEPAA